MRFPPIDVTRVVTYPLRSRKSKVATHAFAAPWQTGGSLRAFLASLPKTLAAADLHEIVQRTVSAIRACRPVILGMGAHPIKVGLSPLIVDFLERGLFSAVAMNGAAVIHDFELAYHGETSEEVAEALADGSFGMAEETAEFLNGAISDGVVRDGVGIGEAVGKRMYAARLPYAHLSILATCARLGIPACVHVALGTDIIHMHPQADGAAIGQGSLRDFRLLTSVVAQLEGGMFFNVGSAVILPEVFLKALSLARNLGYVVNAFTTVDIDFIRHYRPQVNVVSRPTQQGGRGFHLTGHHEIIFPLLCAAVLEALAEEPLGEAAGTQ
ncbi:MAG: hypothetical protein NZ578_09405 [Candidatus Binatia bacterium]|nr:hypothetical protein [Candidatus Binatia bacterium]